MLTDIEIRNAKLSDRAYKLTDGQGMYLLVNRVGKYWRLDYRFGGKRKTLALGVYPDVGLKAARHKRDEARRLLAQGIDPSAYRKLQKAAQADSFEAIAREWFAKYSPSWNPSHAEKIILRLEKNIFPWLGKRPIREVTAQELLACLRRIEYRGKLETAHRALQTCGRVFSYAIATGRADRDISADLKGALPPSKTTHFAAITDPKAFGKLLLAIDGYGGHFVTWCALKLAPLVFVRPGELRTMRWQDVDWEQAQWRYTVPKTATQHIVPLSRQAMEILEDIHPLTGDGHYVFPNLRSRHRPMSNNALLAALRNLGYANMTVHGFRASARTLLDEALGFPPHLIEHQLAHTVRDPLGRAYNRTSHLRERIAMMQRWADYLDLLRSGENIIPMPVRSP